MSVVFESIVLKIEFFDWISFCNDNIVVNAKQFRSDMYKISMKLVYGAIFSVWYLVIIVTRFRFRFRFHNNSWCKWFCMRSACMYSTFVSFGCDVIYVIIFPQILKACLLYLITHINRWTNKRHNERPNERMNQRTNERMPILNWILKQHLRLFLDIMFEHIQHIMAMTEYMFSFPFALWITAVRWREKPPRDNTTYTIYISVGSSGRQANLYIHLYLYIYTNRMKREKKCHRLK